MTVGLAPAHANALLNVLRGTTFTGIATVTMQLHTADPGAAGTTGASAGDATKRTVTWNAASAGSMTVATSGTYTNGGTTETITHVSFWDGATFLRSAALSASQAWVSTNTLTFGTCTLSFTPIAA